MLNALSTRTVLGLLVLAAPVMAIIPPGIDLQLVGAQQISAYEYTVMGGDKIGLSVTAKPHALVWAFALPLDENGEWSGGILVPLLYEEDSASGQESVSLKVPEGVAGMFQVEAVAITAEGELHSATLRVLVEQAPKIRLGTGNAGPILE